MSYIKVAKEEYDGYAYSDNINYVDIPVDGYIAFTETVNRGLKEIHNNNKTFEANKIHSGGNYLLENDLNIGAKRLIYNIGGSPVEIYGSYSEGPRITFGTQDVPKLSPVNNQSRSVCGYIQNEIEYRATPSFGVNALGNPVLEPEIITFNPISASSTPRILKYYTEASLVETMEGKIITFKNDGEEILLELRSYFTSTDYINNTINYYRNIIVLYKDNYISLLFTINDNDGVSFIPVESNYYISNNASPFPVKAWV